MSSHLPFLDRARLCIHVHTISIARTSEGYQLTNEHLTGIITNVPSISVALDDSIVAILDPTDALPVGHYINAYANSYRDRKYLSIIDKANKTELRIYSASRAELHHL